MTEQEVVADALRLHPDCTFAKAEYGLSMFLEPTWQVNVWRNKECYNAGDQPRYVEQGYPRTGPMFP